MTESMALPPAGAAVDTAAVPLLVRAAQGHPGQRPPVWFMRQAGRSLPEYRSLRRGTGMLQACQTPELVTEITLQPVRRHGVDAAILFSDIVVPLVAVGIDVDIVAGTGPVVAEPIRTPAQVEQLRDLEPADVAYIDTAVRELVRELGATPLIGFAGAPFTLASYLIEGGPSKDHARTKALMYSQPELWHALLARLASITAGFLQVQIDAGVSAVQLFDSWAGALTAADYARYVLPHSTAVLNSLRTDVPTIHFGVGTAHLLTLMRTAGADVVGVDWRTPLDVAAASLRADSADAGPVVVQGNPVVVQGNPVVVQGNLDPAIVLADWDTIETNVRRIVAEGRAADGHIFNLGHGVLPDTDPSVLTRIVELVHSL